MASGSYLAASKRATMYMTVHDDDDDDTMCTLHVDTVKAG